LLLILFSLFIWPFAAYLISYYVVAPKIIGNEVADMAADLHMLSEVKEENQDLRDNNESLSKSLSEERKYRAEAEARVAIVENARATAMSKLQKTENTAFELKNRLAFYSALMEKSAEKAPVQCFNIQLENKGENLGYKVNFMIEDVDNKVKKTYKVKFRVIDASNLSVDEVEKLPVVHSREISFRRDVHISGDIKIGESEEALRIIDIRAYDRSDKLSARCWKAF
jgi:hypothetical protein